MATIKKACKGVSYPKSSSVSRRLKTGGSFPDLNKDGKITKADILKGRGVIAKKGMTIKKAQNGNTFIDAVKAKKQMEANKNPTFTANFTNKKGVTNSYETDTTGLAAGKKRFPWRGTNTKNNNVRYGSASRTAVTKALEKQSGKQKNGGKTAKKK
jgi:hypothetical protein